MRHRMRRSRRLQVGQQLHQLAIHHRIPRWVFAQQLLSERRHFVRRDLPAHQRELHHAQQIEEIGVAQFARLLPRLLTSPRIIASQRTRICCATSFDGYCTNSPVAPRKNDRGDAAASTWSCQSFAGNFSSARRAANATNRSLSASKPISSRHWRFR